MKYVIDEQSFKPLVRMDSGFEVDFEQVKDAEAFETGFSGRIVKIGFNGSPSSNEKCVEVVSNLLELGLELKRAGYETPAEGVKDIMRALQKGFGNDEPN